MESLLPTINLPLPILLHALGLTALGVYLTFNGARPTLGLASTGLGLAYLSTSYMPIELNQFLHASVPVRMILAGLAALRLPTARTQDRMALITVTLYDALGGLILGYTLGRWDGKVPGY
ncbi:hypothetical protein PABG_04044 [Paracoccidioides brasiliensis Pb03]|uniref:Uncharacterized protein n=1 Tax=Paracoccidioides brasiliensis (strain Pb18) TaxID=502780 RepID=A0A0A0HQZ3_PARBD|nr:uncharacterized protein PADG_12308 [Paracoccidioides brasiliensis Pb18]EEH21828.2 hypothetical protein PABG_04044 [Paracoccidioides brasiliensis Pb03]KGM91624.1 hypothetical protein PADG_12308 [Paracoccidioides brasiliensis Pb18]ODH51068.1 hypothetical protein GX48_02853 [Paracoccidioides brasiliensis]